MWSPQVSTSGVCHNDRVSCASRTFMRCEWATGDVWDAVPAVVLFCHSSCSLSGAVTSSSPISNLSGITHQLTGKWDSV
uniref:Uncharacterized protein n=1 Tax=Anopheles dirus TaxID=7168 RepID=A0A182NYQ8_9DIPT